MAYNQRRALFLRICSLVLMCIFINLLVPAPVRADVGPQPVLPGGSSIQPGEETPIQMVAETVVMTVRAATEADNALVTLAPETYGLQFYPVWYPGIAVVEADFTMKNPTGEAVSMTVWFPLASALENTDWNFNPREIVPRIESFQVSVNGNPLDYAVSELPNPKGADKPPLPWASFAVVFPDEKEMVIHVNYMLPLQPSVKGNEMALYYIFQTGAGWAGPIGQAELILNLPYPASMETLAGIPPGHLYLPPMNVGQMSTGVPSGAVLEGNQARWMWKDFEPGSQDDFAIWLLQPAKWQEMETARAAVQANPQDGQAWLNLASTCYSLATSDHNFPLIFSPSYIPPGIEAYQKAAELLPEHPAPHAGLALFRLAPYMRDKNAPAEVIQYVQDEFQVARELEATNPTLANETGISRWLLDWLEDVLDIYFYNNVTATAEWVAWSTDWARQTAEVVLLAPPSVTPERIFTPTATPVPSTTPQLPTATSPIAVEATGSEQRTVMIVAAGVIVLVVVGTLALTKLRKHAEK